MIPDVESPSYIHAELGSFLTDLRTRIDRLGDIDAKRGATFNRLRKAWDGDDATVGDLKDASVIAHKEMLEAEKHIYTAIGYLKSAARHTYRMSDAWRAAGLDRIALEARA